MKIRDKTCEYDLNGDIHIVNTTRDKPDIWISGFYTSSIRLDIKLSNRPPKDPAGYPVNFLSGLLMFAQFDILSLSHPVTLISGQFDILSV